MPGQKEEGMLVGWTSLNQTEAENGLQVQMFTAGRWISS